MEESQTTICEATGQKIATRFTRLTEDRHVVSVQAYNTAGLERMNFNLTLADIKDTLKEIDDYNTVVRKFVLWVLENVDGDKESIKIKNVLNIQQRESIEHFKKYLCSITRAEHLQLMNTVPYKGMVWGANITSESGVLDSVNKYLNYFSFNNKFAV